MAPSGPLLFQSDKIALMAQPDIDALFAETLLGDYDDDKPWNAVQSLRRIGTREVFNKAVAWTESVEPLERARGLDVIAQLGKTADHRSNSFPQESYDIAIKVVQRERAVEPLNSAISALGHVDDPRAVPLIAGFHSHPSETIRFTVACSLGCFPNDPLSVHTLLTLMEDADADVRDWATFGLGVLGDQDSPEIREALSRRLNDEDVDAREEALVGLAKRHDTHVLGRLINELEQTTITDRVVEAAYTLLGFDKDQEEWSRQDYARALRERFSGVAPQES
jgi:HEAT repeat protein